MDKTKAAIAVNGSVTLKPTVKGPSQTVKWSSSNNKIATVSSTGKVSGVAAGTVTITATANGVKTTCKVTVVKLASPTLTNWRKTHDASTCNCEIPHNGVWFGLSWNAVSGASGYQVYYRSKDVDGNIFSQKIEQTKRSYSVGFSDIPAQIGVKVRAYKSVYGQRVYGPWSSFKTKKLMTDYDKKYWYLDILKKTSGTYRNVLHQSWDKTSRKNVNLKDFKYYYVMDFNKDGVNELLLTTSKDKSSFNYRMLIMTNNDGTIAPLICFVPQGGARAKIINYGKYIVLFDSGSNNSYTIIYKINGGKVVKAADTKYVNYKPGKEYRINGVSVSEKKYDLYNQKFHNLSEINPSSFYTK